mmetsp:Transcript_23013/g.35234  ORF Transcript_23013/g.35234 Transcript_23013/m.35234 type:complete len:218 (-) Transcript_23013:1492-2145(-)
MHVCLLWWSFFHHNCLHHFGFSFFFFSCVCFFLLLWGSSSSPSSSSIVSIVSIIFIVFEIGSTIGSFVGFTVTFTCCCFTFTCCFTCCFTCFFLLKQVSQGSKGIAIGKNVCQFVSIGGAHPFRQATIDLIVGKGGNATSTAGTPVRQIRGIGSVHESTLDASAQHKVVSGPTVVAALAAVGCKGPTKVRCLQQGNLLPDALRFEFRNKTQKGSVEL